MVISKLRDRYPTWWVKSLEKIISSSYKIKAKEIIIGASCEVKVV